MWSAELSENESETAHDLQLILDQIRPGREGSDRRKWKTHAAGFFTVKAAYVMLQN
ncbi:hypothetical protein A2U01_0060647, partial [Trifolium medium]|nr:hypothetical protein [Trifolium medium]